MLMVTHVVFLTPLLHLVFFFVYRRVKTLAVGMQIYLNVIYCAITKHRESSPLHRPGQAMRVSGG